MNPMAAGKEITLLAPMAITRPVVAVLLWMMPVRIVPATTPRSGVFAICSSHPATSGLAANGLTVSAMNSRPMNMRPKPMRICP